MATELSFVSEKSLPDGGATTSSQVREEAPARDVVGTVYGEVRVVRASLPGLLLALVSIGPTEGMSVQ